MEHAGAEVSAIKFWVPEPPEEVSARLERRLRLAAGHVGAGRIGGAVSGVHAEFYLPDVRRVSKATQLVVEMEQADGGTLVRGQFIQHPYVFVLALALVVVCAFGGLLAVSYAFAQWSMGQPPTGLVGVVFFGLLAIGAYLTSHSRRVAGDDKANELCKFVEDAVRLSSR